MQVWVSEESIQNASAQFWEQMLAMRLEPSAAEGDLALYKTQERCIGERHVVGSCDLAGVWVGRIEVRLSTGLATEATAAMLMQPAHAVEAADLLDATKEIANMIAGTIKSALPRPCTMSVPSAQVEREDFCILPRTADSVTVFFRHASGEMMIRVWQQPKAAETENSHAALMCA